MDLKDAFHSLKLTEKAKDFCGILPYFGSPHYRYEVMPMGLSISPCKWIEYINYVMENMTHKQNFGQTWTQAFTQEVSVFQNRTSVHEKCIQGRQREVCDHPNQNQSGSYSEHPHSTHSKGMQKLLWSGKLSESLLSKFTEASSPNL